MHEYKRMIPTLFSPLYLTQTSCPLYMWDITAKIRHKIIINDNIFSMAVNLLTDQAFVIYIKYNMCTRY